MGECRSAATFKREARAVPLDTIATGLTVVLFVGFFLWLAIGTQLNVRRGNAFLRWLGSSAVELVIAEPTPPFRAVTLILVLEPRDLPWLWALARTRGRRDVVIIRADLRSAPRADLEVAEAGSWSARLPIQTGDDMVDLQPIDWPTSRRGPVSAQASAGFDQSRAVRAWAALDDASAGVTRLSVRRTVPHVEVHLRPPDDSRSADRFVRAVQETATEMAGVR